MVTQERLVQSHALRGLRDPRLLRELAYINGKWVASENGDSIAVTNPSNGAVLGYIPNLGPADTATAIDQAQAAFAAWQARLPQDRSAILRRWYDLMLENKDDLALIMTLEQGKPLSESLGEIDYAASFIAWYAEEARRVNVENVTPHLPDREMVIRREPVGVVACVTPWNFPSAMLTRKAAAALAAGCTVVSRPASETPFSALALAELAERAGIPAGVFSVITGAAQPIVGEMCRNHLVRAMSFTGSTQVGRKLLAQGAATVKKMSMELGGHAPFIAFPDVDMDKLVKGAIAAKFATTGQDCLAANRIYVHREIYDAFVARFAKAAQALKMGDGLEDGVELGPLMHERAVEKCEEHVRDALQKGAKLITGGKRHALGGLFYEATVLADVSEDMEIYREETFGPVAAIIPFDEDTDILAKANDSEYGLVAYVFSDSQTRIQHLSQGLEYGMVAVNTAKITGAPIPFGGVKQSGLGREGSRQGLEEFTEIKYICKAAL